MLAAMQKEQEDKAKKCWLQSSADLCGVGGCCHSDFLLGGRDVQLAQLGLQVGVDLQLQQGLRDGALELVGLLIVGLQDLPSRGERHLERRDATRGQTKLAKCSGHESSPHHSE